MEPSSYTGRFAPSPTGPLHFGSLLAALASYLEARSQGGRWFVRIEDIDPPREQPGSADEILRALSALGFEWDGPIVWQSASEEAHRAALAALAAGGYTYYCTCSRRDLVDADHGPLGTVYPGTCRGNPRPQDGHAAIRVLTDDSETIVHDRLQGTLSQQLESSSGDFVVWRRDGLAAYHLAVVVDDHLQGVTDIVRGIDLLDSTPRQAWLRQRLTYPAPSYAHIPVAVARDGRKLGKSTNAPPLPLQAPAAVLVRALAALQHPVPDEVTAGPLADLWRWAIANWRLSRLRKLTDVPGE